MRGKWMVMFMAASLLAAAGTTGYPPRRANAEPLLLASGDDSVTMTDGDTLIDAGVRFVTLRAAAAAFHASIGWDSPSRVAVIEGGGVRIEYDTAKQTASVDGGPAEPLTVKLLNGRLYVPLRYTAGHLGFRLSALGSAGLGVRVTNGSESLSDEAMTAKLAMELEGVKAERVRLARLEADKIAAAKAAARRDAAKQAAAGKYAKPAKQSVQSGGKTVYLTFDDGPTATTPGLLDTLERYGAHATFFMLGPQIEAHPSYVKRMIKDGDALGVHGMTHRKELVYRSPESVVAEMDGANASLKNAVGIETKLIRVPYGSKPYMKEPFRDAVAEAHYRMWDWNVDSCDSRKGETTEQIRNETIRQVGVLSGKHVNPVILFHDHQHTLEALPAILDYLNASGYSYGILSADMDPLNFWHDER